VLPYNKIGCDQLNIRFLGTHHSESKNTRLASFLVDDIIAVDAGSLASELTFPEQENIKAILLSHEHYDHIKGVPSFIFSNLDQTTNVYATEQTLNILSSHLFDGKIYPKFTEKTPFLDKPPIKLITVEPFNLIEVEGYKVLTLPVTHTKGSVGYEITSKDGKKIFYTGDTGPDLSNLWEHISPDLVIIDVTFPNRMEKTAKNASHLCPKMLKNELESFNKEKGYFPKVLIIHLSPEFEEEIKKEVKVVEKELGISIGIAREGQKLTI
jgi:phosphoribosyl 1,2-cyclic phosphodiesterase